MHFIMLEQSKKVNLQSSLDFKTSWKFQKYFQVSILSVVHLFVTKSLLVKGIKNESNNDLFEKIHYLI